MSDPYQDIADILARLRAPDGNAVRLNATLDDAFSDLEYAQLNGEEATFVVPSPSDGAQVHTALHELRADMTMSGEAPWSRCTFTLFPDGKFKFDVEYDD